jgi:hypothetical protein
MWINLAVRRPVRLTGAIVELVMRPVHRLVEIISRLAHPVATTVRMTAT